MFCLSLSGPFGSKLRRLRTLGIPRAKQALPVSHGREAHALFYPEQRHNRILSRNFVQSNNEPCWCVFYLVTKITHGVKLTIMMYKVDCLIELQYQNDTKCFWSLFWFANNYHAATHWCFDVHCFENVWRFAKFEKLFLNMSEVNQAIIN